VCRADRSFPSYIPRIGHVAEWLRNGLQRRVEAYRPVPPFPSLSNFPERYSLKLKLAVPLHFTLS